ncbi:hypothetical protein ACFQU2_14910 [Siccirubricoccus deserti]
MLVGSRDIGDVAQWPCWHGLPGLAQADMTRGIRGMDTGDNSSAATGWSRRGLLGLALALATASPVLAAAPVLATVRGRTRLVVPLGRPVAWALSAANTPPRLILDLPGLPWQGPDRLRGSGVVKEVRRQGSGLAQQLVLTLARPVAAPSITATGRRLVLELVPGSAAGFARLANGRVLAAAAAPRGRLPWWCWIPVMAGAIPARSAPRAPMRSASPWPPRWS